MTSNLVIWLESETPDGKRKIFLRALSWASLGTG